jgi:hypothetical protein
VTKHGGESKYRVVRLSADYNKIKASPELTSLGPLEAILAGRLMELIERVDTGDMPERMQALRDEWIEFKRTHPNIDTMYPHESAKKSFAKIDEIMDRVYHDYKAWEQILDVVEQKRKLSETKIKLLKELKVLIGADDAYKLVAQLLAVVTKVVDDPNAIRQIQYEFAKAVGDLDIPESPDGGGQTIDLDARPVDRGEFLHTRDSQRSETTGENPPDPVPAGLPE